MKFLRYGMITVLVLALGAGAAWARTSAGYCVGCHDSLNPNQAGGTLHTAHNTFINDCLYCHTTVGDTPDTRMSGNDSSNSCSGCHVLGGVNLHHSVTGASSCGCHSGEPQISESDTPPYYGTAATSLRFSCFDGLDNDGDDVYDGNDSDCVGVPNDERSWSVIKQIYGDE